jgi:hypothetical protein
VTIVSEPAATTRDGRLSRSGRGDAEKISFVRLYACRVEKPGTVQGERVRNGAFGQIGRIVRKFSEIKYVAILAAIGTSVPSAVHRRLVSA